MKNETSIKPVTPPDAKRLLGDVFLSILNRIAIKNDMRDWMPVPFNANGKSMATNGYCLVATPTCGEFTNREDKIKSVYPLEQNQNKPIKLQEIKDKLALFPTVDCFDETEQECNACYGSGLVDFEFDYEIKSYELEGECPICEGEGTTLQTSKIPNGKKELDYNKLFQIGLCAFNVERINELIFIAENIGVDEVFLVNQTLPHRPSVFLIGEVEFLVMSTLNSDLDRVAQNIA